MLSDIPDCVDANDCTRSNFMLESHVHLPRARGSVIGIENIKPIRVRCVQRCAHIVPVRLGGDAARGRGLERIAEGDDLVTHRRDRSVAESGLDLVHSSYDARSPRNGSPNRSGIRGPREWTGQSPRTHLRRVGENPILQASGTIKQYVVPDRVFEEEASAATNDCFPIAPGIPCESNLWC